MELSTRNKNLIFSFMHKRSDIHLKWSITIDVTTCIGTVYKDTALHVNALKIQNNLSVFNINL